MTTMSFRAEAEFINEAFPSNQNIIMPPDTPISPTPPPQPTNLDEDELESLVSLYYCCYSHSITQILFVFFLQSVCPLLVRCVTKKSIINLWWWFGKT